MSGPKKNECERESKDRKASEGEINIEFIETALYAIVALWKVVPVHWGTAIFIAQMDMPVSFARTPNLTVHNPLCDRFYLPSIPLQRGHR